MDQDIIETVQNFRDQAKDEKWNLSDYTKNVIDTLLFVYSKSDFHPNVIDQIICMIIPTFNNYNRFDLKITRRIHNNNIQELNRLLNIPKSSAQKSIEWKLKRHNHINASEANAVLGGSRKSLLISKANPLDETSNSSGAATEHGTLFEPISNEIHSFKIKKKIYEFESIEHPVYHFIAASPDGITEDGDLVEYKNPKTRKIVGVPKKDYWVQTQFQMEVTNLARCQFVECSYNHYLCLEDFLESNDEFKGVIIVYFDLEQKKHVIYSPLNMSSDEYFSWYENEKDKINKNNMLDEIHIELSWWGLKQYSCFTVYRDKQWFNDTLPIFKEFWNEVIECRKNPSLIPIHTKKEKITAPIIIDNNYKIDYEDYI
jgi:putative phage-type endonuclease